MDKNDAKNELLKEYFNAVVVEDVLTASKTGKVYLGGVEITPGELSALQKDAEYFKKSKLASILWNSIYSQAQTIMFEKAKSFEDMMNGKMMMYNISVQKKIVDILARKPSKK